MIIALIPLGVLLDLLVWRRRHLAGWLIYYESLSIFVQGFVPFNFGDFQGLILIMVMIMASLNVLCDTGPAIIVSSLSVFIVESTCYSLVLKKGFSVGVLFGAIVNALACTLILTALCMMIVYIAKLKSHITILLEENISLLDKMHEGLIVVSKDENMSLKFAS